MNNFKTVYRLLKTLEKSMDLEEFDKDSIPHQSLGISYPRQTRIIQATSVQCVTCYR